MNRHAMFAALGLLSTALATCSPSNTVRPPMEPPPPAACADKRPDWVTKVPATDSYMYFVGLSGSTMQETDARNESEDNAIGRAVRYIGTDVYQKIERARVLHGLSSDVADPVRAQREIERLVREAFVAQFQAREYHTECERRGAAWGYKVFALGAIPTAGMNEAYSNAMRKYSQTLKGDQADQARKLFDDLAAQGLAAPKR